LIARIKDKQLRQRIFQAPFRGIQRAIEEEAKEHGVTVIYVNPKNTSRLCPVHDTPINYNNSSRIGKCGKGGELWHRDVVACWNLLLKALRSASLECHPWPHRDTQIPMGEAEVPTADTIRYSSKQDEAVGTNGR